VKRRFIGRYNDVVTRHAIYATGDAIEVDERDNFAIVRKRVFFEDVLLITSHERVGIGPIFFSLGFAFFLLLVGLIAGGVAGWTTALFSTPFFVYGILRIQVKETIVTVFGRRSRARIRFAMRRRHAQQLYDELCEQVRRAQSAMNPPADEERSSEERREEPWLTSIDSAPPQ